jgi:hypothetical protein
VELGLYRELAVLLGYPLKTMGVNVIDRLTEKVGSYTKK